MAPCPFTHSHPCHLSGADPSARWHDQLGISTLFEYSNDRVTGYDNGTVSYLRGLGYNTSFVAPGSTTSHAIGRLPDGQLLAAAEVRKLAAYGAAY